MINIIDKKISNFALNTFLIDENNKSIKYKNILSKASKKLDFIKSRSFALILAENCTSFIEIYFYFLKKKVAQMLIDLNSSDTNLKEIVIAYRPNYILINKKRKIKITGLKLKSKLGNYLVYEFFKKKINIDENLAILLPTSGSTGSPKFVKLSYLNIFDNAKNISKYLKIKKNHKTITTMPPSYSYGLSIINSHFFSGAKIVMNAKSFFEKEFWKKINRYKITSFGAVPYHYEMLKKLKFHNFKLPHLKYLTQAGGALKKEIIKYFINLCEKKMIKFIQMYGQTEASPRISYLPFKKAKTKIGSIGKVIPGGKIFLINKNKKSGVGELSYKGNNVFMGYTLGQKDLQKSKRKITILKTGDLAKKDREGYYYVVGRKDRIVKVAGNRIDLEELNKIARRKGIECEFLQNNNKIKVFTKNQTTTEDTLNNLCSDIQLNKNYFEVIKIDKFPLNSRGKIDLLKLKNYDRH